MEQPRITVQYKADQLEQTTWFFSQIYLPDNFTNITEYFAKILQPFSFINTTESVDWPQFTVIW